MYCGYLFGDNKHIWKQTCINYQERKRFIKFINEHKEYEILDYKEFNSMEDLLHWVID